MRRTVHWPNNKKICATFTVAFEAYTRAGHFKTLDLPGAARNFRGPLARKHPYLADDAQIVVSGLASKEVVDKVLGYWDRYVGR